MNRRTLLTALTSGITLSATAGCLQGLGTGSGIGSDDRTTRSSTRTTEDDARGTDHADPKWDPDGGPVQTFRVGDRDAVVFPDSNQPHDLTFWNRVDREREVRIEVVDGAADGTSLGPVTVPAGYTLAVELLEPARYALAVVVDDDSFGTVTVGRRWFDCNDSGTSYALAETEVVDYGTASTLVACAAPAVADTTLDVDDRGCATDGDDTATVAYDGETVRVTGTFVASAPCYELSIAEATYRDDRRTATVVVDATAPDEACADCVGAIDYTATVAFERDLPDRFELRHRDAAGDDALVATATRN